MSVRRLAPDPVQPASFAFTAANENWIVQQIAKYPEGRQASAVVAAHRPGAQDGDPHFMFFRCPVQMPKPRKAPAVRTISGTGF